MTTEVDRLLYGGRTIRTRDDDNGERVEGWGDVAREALRGLCHITISPGAQGIPAPVAYDVLGNLSAAASMIEQLAGQLDRGLRASLDAEGIEVYDRERDPRESVAAASGWFDQARSLAVDLSSALGAAQIAINEQGYEETTP